MSSASSSALPVSVAGFTPLPISYSSATHIIYVHAHTKKGKAKDAYAMQLPDGRTLFAVNVPPDATEREVAQFFKSSGTVERVVFSGSGAEEEEEVLEESSSEEEEEEEVADEDKAEERPRKKRKKSKNAPPEIVPLPSVELRTFRHTGQNAHVVFLDASSLTRALTPPTKPRAWPTDSAVPLGLAHYTAQYESLRPPLDVVKAHADSWMEHFEWEAARKKQKSKYRKGEAIVDEDGFTLVVRGGAYGKTLGGGVGVASKKFVEERTTKETARSRKRNGKKEKEAFYAFQIHEKRRNELIDLKQKWEEDKAKVERLKESRKFRPY